MSRQIYRHRPLPLLRSLMAFRSDPLAAMEAMRARHGDLVYFGGPLRSLFVFHPDDIKTVVFQHAEHMIKGAQSHHLKAATGDGVFTSEGRDWREKRRLIGGIFTTRVLQQYAQTMQGLVDDHMARWPVAARFDLGEAVAHLAFAISGELFFGGIADGRAAAIKDAAECMGAIIFQRIATPFPLPLTLPLPSHRRFIAAKRRIDELVYELIRERRASPSERPDVLTKLLSSDKNLSEKQVRDEAVTLLIAGFETSSTMIAWTLHLLGLHAEHRQRLALMARNEAADGSAAVEALTRATLKESLRLFPPSPIISRQNKRPVELAGETLPIGTNFVMSQYIAHRDARFWTEPERFLPERFLDEAREPPPYSYFPFSLGPRRCIGEELALSEGVIILKTLFKRFEVEIEPVERLPVCEVILHPDRPIMASLRAVDNG